MGTGRRKERQPEEPKSATSEIPMLDKLIPIGEDDEYNPVIMKTNEAKKGRNLEKMNGARSEAAKRLIKKDGGN